MSKYFITGGSERLRPYGRGKRSQHMADARFNGGAGGGAPEPTAEEKLLGQIKEKVSEELNNRNFQNREAVDVAIREMLFGKRDKDGKPLDDKALGLLGGMSLDALRKIDENFNASELKETVTKMAATIEKMKQNRKAQAEGTRKKSEIFREIFKDEDFMRRCEKVFNSRDSHVQITLNARAAAVISMGGDAGTPGLDDTGIPEDIIESFSVDSFVRKRRPNEYIFDFVTRRTVPSITKYKTWLEESGEEGAFAVIDEGIVKPLVSKSLVRNTSQYRKIAGKRIYTEEFVKFRTEAYNIIEDLFNDQLMRNYCAVLVTSLLAAAASYIGSALDSQYVNPTDYHAIAAVCAQIEGLNFVPDVLILNPQDKWRIAMEQDKNGQFFLNVPTIDPRTGLPSILGLTVITSNRVDVGNFIVGESGLYKVEDEPVTVKIGYGITVTGGGGDPVTDVISDFDNNQFRIIAETFFHNYIASNHEGSFVYAAFADVKTSVTAEEPA